MLKQRIITGLILAVVAIAVLFFMPIIWFEILTAAVVLLGAWEWRQLAGLKNPYLGVLYLVVTLLGMVFVRKYVPLFFVVSMAILFWFYAFYLVLSFPKATSQWHSHTVRLLMGMLVLISCWVTIVAIREHQQGVKLLLMMFLLVFSADIGAYFTGRVWGVHKIRPTVSPNKSWEGFLGGLFLSLIVVIIAKLFLVIQIQQWVTFLLMVVLLNIVSVTGDFFESMLKRNVQLKDSGRLLPGHGGVLDRVDSLMAAAPFFLLGLLLNIFY